MTKIIIAGIGGVGGFFGGLLAKRYEGNSEVEINFLSRGNHLNEIQEKGLKVLHGDRTFSARPHLASDNAKDLGLADYILMCTKSYDLEASIEQLKPCIAQHTIILPLLNGVDASERIQVLLPENKVLKGCVYIVSHLKEPGVIENSGNIQKLFFGLDNETNQDLLLLETLFKNAGIEVTLSEEISKIIWQKFIFVSPIAASTSYFDASIGKVLEENETLLIELIDEITLIALAKGIKLDSDIREKSLHLIKSLAYNNTSSMHRDFKGGKGKTEIESLLAYVIKEGEKLAIETSAYIEIYKSLSARL